MNPLKALNPIGSMIAKNPMMAISPVLGFAMGQKKKGKKQEAPPAPAPTNTVGVVSPYGG